MSSLVAYGSSDESDNESANEEDNTFTDESKESALNSLQDQYIQQENDVKQEKKHGLFSSLPSPKTSASSFSLVTDEEKLIAINDKQVPRKQPVKITIPFLSEFKEDESEPTKKKLKPSSKGSGLFSLLPAPKNLSVKESKRSLVPHVLTKKPSNMNPEAIKPAPPILTMEDSNSLKKNSSLINYADSEEESGDEGDFFSLKMDSTVETNLNHTETLKTESFPIMNSNIHDLEITDQVDVEESNDEPLAFNSKFKPSPWASTTTQGGNAIQWQNVDGQPSTSHSPQNHSDDFIPVHQEDLQLNDEALQRLCGRRAKRQQQDMQLIEVSGDAIMPDPNEWLTKQMTQEQETKSHSHSHRKNDGPTTQQRRKHQITYLAFQAKENELELKNQWSQNRMSRKQTQSKYGF